MMSFKTKLFSKIENTIRSLDFENISLERKTTLQPIVDFIQNKTAYDQQIRLNFICTHNSRRSHLFQIWAQTAAYYYNIKNVTCYSGGTESTALFPEVAATLMQIGFQIKTICEGNNPIYAITYAENELPIIGFSKTYDDNFNPKSEFAAVLTCSQADGGCPFIAGAEKRIIVTYQDPKVFDHTPQQQDQYKERSLQIALEMCYVFSQIKS